MLIDEACRNTISLKLLILRDHQVICTISCGQQLFLPDQGSENINYFLKKDTFLRTYKQDEAENWENLFCYAKSCYNFVQLNFVYFCFCEYVEVSGYF